ncbi:MAG: aminomethyl-transferring glycine dehydrogenase subunit GcvPA [Candidatus Acetothermia bacterium]
MDYLPTSEEQQEEMLAELGVESVEELFEDIPAEIRDRFEPTGIDGHDEMAVDNKLTELASKNDSSSNRTQFLGGGVYDHFIPSLVDHVTGRSEFYTAYTPYQAEISQGTLTWMFEFQSHVAELTGMDIANSSMYDGASATAEAVHLCLRVREGNKAIVAENLNPRYRQVLETYLPGSENEIIDLPSEGGRIDRKKLQELIEEEEGIASVVLQSPNYFGLVEDLGEIEEYLNDEMLVVATNPLSLGIFEPPGNFGADVVTGEGQPLGNPPNYGGPLLGLFATKKEYIRALPGRVSGLTTDNQGNEGYVMALQTREQHIRRENATSNICTNQALNALAATVYLTSLGPEGFQEVARLNWDKAHYLASRIEEISGFSLEWDAPFFNEFTVRVEGGAEKAWKELHRAEIDTLHPKYLYPLGLKEHLLIAVTEKRTHGEMDRLVEVLKGAKL